MIRTNGKKIKYTDKVYAPCEPHYFQENVMEMVGQCDSKFYQECDENGFMIDGEILEFCGIDMSTPSFSFKDCADFEKFYLDMFNEYKEG